MPTTPTVFISYSHQDEVWKDRLVTHLGVLEHQGFFQNWDDRKIKAGDEWFEEIRKGMAAAKLAVLLISANSLTTELRPSAPTTRSARISTGPAGVFPRIPTIRP